MSSMQYRIVDELVEHFPASMHEALNRALLFYTRDDPSRYAEIFDVETTAGFERSTRIQLVTGRSFVSLVVNFPTEESQEMELTVLAEPLRSFRLEWTTPEPDTRDRITPSDTGTLEVWTHSSSDVTLGADFEVEKKYAFGSLSAAATAFQDHWER